MNEVKNQLNKEQEEAVFHGKGPLLIVAGAGTGKTKVITERIANIINKKLANSDEILALTFTEKAAGEMEERVDKLLPLGYFDLWISTFHSFGEKILRENGLDIGISSDFKLLSEFEQYSLFKKNLDKFDLDYYMPMGNPTKFIRTLLKHFSRAKDEDISPEEYLKYADELKQNLDGMLSGSKKTTPSPSHSANAQGRLLKRRGKNSASFQGEIRKGFCNADGEFNSEIAEQEVLRINEVANAYHVYQKLLLDNSALDFGDLINYCLKLFRERPNILEKYRAKFKYVLLDEFQDTNLAQYELIKMLVAPNNNVVVLADDDQSIFRFRGASMSNILQFRHDYPDCKKIMLIQNYRNKQNILDLSYNFISLNNPNRLEYQFQQNKDTENLDKKLTSNTGDKGQIEIIEGIDSADEIAQVVNKIAEIKAGDKEIMWSDFAILTRANEHAKGISSFLDEAKFPYLLFSSRGLYAKEVIINVVSYLKSLVDYYDNANLFKVLTLPIFNFNFEELISYNYLARKKAVSLYQILNNPAEFGISLDKPSYAKATADKQNRINSFLSLFKKHANLIKDKHVSDIILAFINDTGYLKFLLKQDEKKAREATNFLNKFMKRVKEFEQDSDDKGTKAFLNELEVEIEAGEQGKLPVSLDDGPDTIKIMTVHASKGLEFKYVFITNMVDKRFPTTEKKEPILLPNELVKENLPEGEHHLEEERRLFYVAITRARDGVFFSWTPDCGGKRAKRPSRFLVEAKLIEDLSIIKNEELRIKNGDKKEIDLLKKKSEVKDDSEIKLALPKAFSYTQLAAFSNCPYQYRFAHILKIPVRGKVQFSFGKTMHSTMQKIFDAIIKRRELKQDNLFKDSAPEKENITLDECLRFYKESWIDEWYDSEGQKEKFKKKGKEIVKDFFEKHNGNWPEAINLEKGFSMKVKVDGEFFTIRGQIDRIDRKDGKIKIVDYKTGSPKEKLQFSEKEQLFIYHMATSELFREEIGNLSFYYLENNTEVEFEIKEKDVEKMRGKIEESIKEIKEAIETNNFKPIPGPLCSFCDYKDICEFRKI